MSAQQLPHVVLIQSAPTLLAASHVLVNLDMCEVGVTVCWVSIQNSDASEHWEELP